MTDLSKIKKNLKSEKIIFGTDETIKNLKQGNVSEVFVTKNCPKDVIEDLEYYVELAGAKLTKLDVANDELGDICKKPYFISVVSLLK